MVKKILKVVFMILGGWLAFGFGCLGYAKLTKNEELADVYEKVGYGLKNFIID